MTEQGNLLSLVLAAWMKEERKRQEYCTKEPTSLSSDTVKAAGGGIQWGQQWEEGAWLRQEVGERQQVAGYLCGGVPAIHRGLCAGSDFPTALE